MAKSAKGVEVDFDLLRIKQQIESAPKPVSTQVREDFVDQKFNRRIKKLTRTVAETVTQSAGELDNTPIAPNTK